MNYEKMRTELSDYYRNESGNRCNKFYKVCCARLDSLYKDGMSPYEMKVLQYNTITDMFDPVLFYSSPFYYETGTMWALCDGSRDFHGYRHPGGWTYWKNCHMFRDQDPGLMKLMETHLSELFYSMGPPEGGAYNDTMQHFNFNNRPVLNYGLKGIYEKALKSLESAQTKDEKDFLNSLLDAMLALKKMSEKFAEKAKQMMENAPDKEAKANMELIYKTAAKTPWEKPETLYEALNALIFMRKAIGTLEGIGPNTYGRIDMDLYPFYLSDIKNGATDEQEYDLVCKFLLCNDLHFDHDMKMVGYADHELENTYVLGGCDNEGNPCYNELTNMFLKATRKERIIFPKITCRYSDNSPKEYLEEINKAISNGTSTVLYQNDNATIPAMIKAGYTLDEARDYLITGCWAIMANGVEKIDDGCYVNILKVLEYTIHKRTDKMKKVEMNFAPIDEAKTFEEVYKIMCDNIMVLFKKRAEVIRKGGNIWDKVDPLPIFSSTMDYCIDKKKDYTAGGGKYRNSRYEIVGFPNVIDSLTAIKTLCFDSKKYTLKELLNAVRNDWNGFQEIRRDAIGCTGWGDGNVETAEFANRFNRDLHDMALKQIGTYGGKIFIGHFTYTEIRWWGLKTLSTPDGRKSGDYIAQGITPSRLKKIKSVSDPINSLSMLDSSNICGNSVINIILPGHTPLPVCDAFLRAASKTGMQSLQLNCVSREQLLDAQKHPENYPELIVRVCGFSAKFTSLSPQWQQEVLSRTFYE